MKDKKFITAVVIVILALIGLFFYSRLAPQQNGVPPKTGDKTVVFDCDAGKTITATFHLPEDANVTLSLSDGRNLTVPHAMSGSGARYANADESFVFWNKGNTAFITEGTGQNSVTTFANCVENDSANAGTGGFATYANSQYGFQIQYSKNLTPTTTFANSYTLQNEWRIEAGQNSTGTPIIAIPVFHIDQGGVATGKAYPLFFDAEVRIGVSSNPADVADCLKPDPNYTNQPESDVLINGVTFKKFSFQNAAMMKYLQGESYRAVHNGICYAIEQVKTGSIYRDPSMSPGIPDTQLDDYYNQAGDIVQTFQFTK